MEWFKNIKQLKPLDWVLLMNAVSILYLKAVPYFLTLLLLILILDLIRGKVAWGNMKVASLIILGTPILLGVIGLLISENIHKGLEECSRLLPFLIFPVVFNFWKPNNYTFFKKLALSIFALTLVIRLLYNFYDSIIQYNITGNTKHFFYASLIEDINIVSIFMFFAILYILEYLIVKKLSRKMLIAVLLVLVLLSTGIVVLQGRIVLLGFWVALIFLFIIYRNYTKKWILLIVLGVTAGAFFIPNFNSRFSSINENLVENSVTEVQVDELGEAAQKEVSDSMLLKTIKKQKNTLLIMFGGLVLMVLLYFTPFHNFSPYLIGVYLLLSLSLAIFSNNKDGFNHKTTDLIEKQEAGLLFTRSYSTSEKYRLKAIETTVDLIKKRPFIGYGTGDWRDALTVRYYELKMQQNFIEQTAPHNQYLRTWLRHGIFGLLAFLAYLFWLLKNTVRSPQVGRYALILCVFLSALGYDVFDVGGSIPFIAYFSCLLFIKPKIRPTNKE